MPRSVVLGVTIDTVQQYIGVNERGVATVSGTGCDDRYVQQYYGVS